MKTTIELPKSILDSAKQLAVINGITLKTLFELALRNYLDEKSQSFKKFRLKKGTFRGNGLQDGIEEGNWGKVANYIYEGRGG